MFNLKAPLTTASFSNNSPHGIFDAIGGIVGSFVGANSQKNALEAQWKMMQNSMNWQHNERLDTQSYNSQEADKQRQWQEQMVNRQNAYNSLEQQVKRAQAAGVNPFSVVSGGGTTPAASAPSGSSASSPGWPSVSWAPAYQAQALGARAQMMNSVFGGIKSIASSLRDIKEAKKSGIETSYLEESMKDSLRKLSADANYQELLNDAQKIINDKLPVKVQRELALLFEKAANLSADTSLSEDRRRKIIADTKGSLAKVDVNDLTRQQLQRVLDNYIDRLYESIISRNNAEASQARSSAALIDVNKEIRDLDYSVRKASNHAEKEAAVAEFTERANQAGIITDQMSEALKLAVKNNDWYTYDRIMSGISAIAGAYSNIRGAGPAPVRESHTQTYEQGEYNGKPYWRETYQDSRR